VNYPSIRIEGGILSPDILDRIEEADGQKPAHFELDSSAKVKDEILRVWADAQDYWRIFQRKLESLKADSPATTETRNLWIVPLLSLLGYQLEYQARGTEVNGKNYPVSHRVTNRKQTPLHIIGYREPSGLDRKPEKMALRMSAHAMVQEYLNLSDQLYGIVTNGRLVRVLRDSSRLVKLSYLEFDLDRIFTDGLFADFAILFRLLHATRLPKNEESAALCWLERYHQKSIDEGTRIRDGLRDAVTEALELLGTGFLAHPENSPLRQQLSSGELRPEIYFNHLLRLVYRLLFLMVVEERGLIFPKGVPPKNISVYFEHYSIQRLRRLASTRGLKIERFHDAWLSLLATFRLFENPAQAARLGTTVFGGQLFNPASLGSLIKCRLTNAALFTALQRLCYFQHPEMKQRMPVNFGALATEEFGSVYESLLELRPVVETEPSPHFGFRQVAGNERKTTGSYYTPTSLVTCLLDSTLDPVLEERIQNFKSLGFKSVDEAVLALNVCDPACGSGHFLIAAAQRITRRLALLRAGDEEPSPELLRHTLREVIGSCIHGVDVNPMSVELCKVALWLEAVEPGKPLNFLDHHINCGNSLLGATPECIRDGIPDKAYEPITGDDKEVAKWMRNLNKDTREGQVHFDFSDAKPWERLGNLPAAMAKLELLDDETPEALHAKEKLYRQIVEGSGYESARLLHDTWCAAFVWPKQSREYGTELTTEHIRKIERNPHSVAAGLKAKVRELAIQYRFFHWHLEFPAVFGFDAKGGFDVVLGNPPWERVKLQEKEWFAERRSEIANAPNAAARKRLIARLAKDDPILMTEFQAAQRQADGESHSLRNSGRYPLCARGDINLYAVFAEGMRNLLNERGRNGCVLPTGIATDDTTKFFFQDVMKTKSLASLFDFENKGIFFPGVHSSYKFCLFTAGRGLRPTAGSAEFVFFAQSVDDLRNLERRFSLSAEDIALLNPNTKTCPIFRSRRDAELTKAIYRRVPVLISEAEDGRPQANPWSISFSTMFHMTNDSHLFRNRDQLEDEGWTLDGNIFHRAGNIYVPLYEPRMINQFDHRFGIYNEFSARGTDQGRCAQPTNQDLELAEFTVLPRFWVSRDLVVSRNAIAHINGMIGFRAVARNTDSRTMICCILPLAGVGNNMPIVTPKNTAASHGLLLCSNLNAFVFDFVVRQKVAISLNFFAVKQLPVLPPEVYSSFMSKSIIARALELTYVSRDLTDFAIDCGWSGPPFRWDEERRFLLRCELDAAFFHLYLHAEENDEWHRPDGETVKDLTQLRGSFRTPRDAAAYVMDTFPIVRRKDEEKFGTYRTKDTILKIYDDLAESQRTGRPYVSRLNPPPGPPTDEHGHFIPIFQWDPNHWPSHIHPAREGNYARAKARE
jgi:N-6 DNA Methylase